MKPITKEFVAAALVAGVLILPAGLAAKERRGADIIVTRLDGTLVSGELIAVKPDSLLLLTPGAADLSIPLSEVRLVRIVRRSKATTFSLVGGAAGFVGLGGYILAFADSDVVGSKTRAGAILGLLAGAAGAALGAIAGSAAGADSVFTVAGQPAEVLAGYWARLASYSRMGRQPRPGPSPAVAPAAPLEAGRPAPGARETAAARPRGPRFRLSVAARFPTARGSSFGGAGAFRFPEETGPEAGPYPLSLQGYTGEEDQGLKLGPFGIAYDWRKRWTAELELMPFRLGYNYIQGEMDFTSSLDGLPYEGFYYSGYAANCLALLAGLNYRLIAPSALQRHAVEAGLAAGPAFVNLKNTGEGSFLLPSANEVAICARVKAAYDFYVVPAFSLGAYAGYLYAETSFSGLEGSMTTLFIATAEPYTERHRPTAAALPVLPVKASGFYWGLRVSFRL